MIDSENYILNTPNINTIFGNEISSCMSYTINNEFMVFLIQKPDKSLSDSVKVLIYKAFIPLTTYAFGADMTSYWSFRAQSGYMENLEQLVLISNMKGELIGWTGYCLLDSGKANIVYNDSSGLIPPYQKKGIMSNLLNRRTAECVARFSGSSKPLLFATRTESPIIYSMRKKLTKKIYPNPDYPTPGYVIAAALYLAEWLGQKEILELHSLVLRNAYGMVDELYGELPTSGNVELDAWINGQVGPLDAFLLIGEGKK